MIRASLIRGQKTQQTPKSSHAQCRRAEMKHMPTLKKKKPKKQTMLNDSTTQLFFLTQMVLCSQHFSQKKKKTNKTRKKRHLPSWTHKMSVTFPSVCRVVFYLCSMLCETKGQVWGKQYTFQQKKIFPFQGKKNHNFTITRKKNPTLLPSKIKRNGAEGGSEAATLALGTWQPPDLG